MKGRERAGIEQWLGSVEQRCEQCCKLDHGLAWIGCAATDSDAEAASDRRDLGEQAALAHARGALDDDHRFCPLGEAFELGSTEREFRVPSMALPHCNCAPPPLPARRAKTPRAPFNPPRPSMP